MSTLAIQSNESSGLLRTLSEAKTQDWSYEMEASAPLLVPSKSKVQPARTFSGTPHNQEVLFNLNKYQLWTGAEIKHTLTRVAAQAPVDKYYGFTLIDRMEIMTNNKTIHTLTGSAIRALVDTLHSEAKEAALRRALPLDANGNVLSATAMSTATTVVCYTPVMSSFFESVRNHLDLSFVEQIQILVRYSSIANTGIDGGGFTASSPEVVMSQYITDNTYLDFLRSRNFQKGQFLNMLTWNTYTQSADLTTLNASVTNATFRLQVNYPTRNMYFALVNITAAATSGSNTNLQRINSFTFQIGGQSLLEDISYLENNRTKEMQGGSSNIVTSNTAISRADTEWICVPFCTDITDRKYNSGALSFYEIQSPVLTINYDTLTVANFRLVVVLEYWNLLSISDSGVMSISQTY